jgi:hypothetical protein
MQKSQPVQVQVALNVTRDEGSIVRAISNNVKNNGELRTIIREEVAYG